MAENIEEQIKDIIQEIKKIQKQIDEADGAERRQELVVERRQLREEKLILLKIKSGGK